MTGGGGSSKRRPLVLVVDDDLFMGRAVACIMMEARDAVVHLARTGDEALPLAEQFSPDLILVDVQMPGMSPGELCRELRQRPATKGCVIYLHTGVLPGNETFQELADWVDGTLGKPPDPMELLRVVDLAMAAAEDSGV
ncbi:MAG: response regulator [Armatimonadota bacterium]